MKQWLYVIIVLLLCCASARAVTLVKAGVAKAAVFIAPGVMAADDSAAERNPATRGPELQRRRLRASVQDLARCLGRMSGATIEVVTAAPAPGETRVPLLVGDYAQTVFGPFKRTSVDGQGWRLAVTERAVGMLGESDEATSYAIYELLHRLGCRWFAPGAMGEDIPATPTVALAPLDVAAVPPLLGRFIVPLDADFLRRNRAGGSQVQINNIGPHAGLQRYLTRELLAAHPAWNAELDGVRAVTAAPCLSHPEVADAAAERIIAELQATPSPTVSLSYPYGARWCGCAACQALDAGDTCQLMGGGPSYTDRYLWFCNRVAERVLKEFPNERFGVLLNMDYIDPPVREKPHPALVPAVMFVNACRGHRLGDPACPTRQELAAILEGWGKLSPRVIGYDFAYNLAEVGAPFPLLRWGQDIPFAVAHGVRYWMPEGWVSDTMPNLESTLPGIYLGLRLAWEPTADPKAILDEFYTRGYGAAGPAMRRYWETLDTAWQGSSEHAGSHFGFITRFPPETLAAARAALREAQERATTARAYRLVQFADEGFRQFELYMKLRRDLNEGVAGNLEKDAAFWLGANRYLRAQYAGQNAYAPLAADFFQWFCQPAYADLARVQREGVVLTKPIPSWRYQVDREQTGEAQGWQQAAFTDAAWPQTDPRAETWADLGLFTYYGRVWYRARVSLPAVPAGKKVYLWIAGVDDACAVYANGQLIPSVRDGQPADEARDYNKPLVFDLTPALQPGAPLQLALRCTRGTLNEIGTGGLLGPVVVYREK